MAGRTPPTLRQVLQGRILPGLVQGLAKRQLPGLNYNAAQQEPVFFVPPFQGLELRQSRTINPQSQNLGNVGSRGPQPA